MSAKHFQSILKLHSDATDDAKVKEKLKDMVEEVKEEVKAVKKLHSGKYYRNNTKK